MRFTNVDCIFQFYILASVKKIIPELLPEMICLYEFSSALEEKKKTLTDVEHQS